MNVLGKSILVLIAAMLVADPVMACCFPSVQDLEPSVSQTDKPPCHGAGTSAVSDAPADTAGQSCPGCGDCASSMAATDHANVVAIAAPLADDEAAAGDEVLTASRVIMATVVPRIPSGYLPRSTETPISLKQRLLI